MSTESLKKSGHAPLMSGVAGSFLFWLVVSGFGLIEAVGVIAVATAVSLWGYAVVRVLDRGLINAKDPVYWLFGPLLALGSLSLFVLSLVMPRGLLLWAFVALPVSLLVHPGLNPIRRITREAAFREVVPVFGRHFLLVTGLTGMILASDWSWALPIAIVALCAAVLAIRRVHTSVAIGGVCVTLSVAIRSIAEPRFRVHRLVRI